MSHALYCKEEYKNMSSQENSEEKKSFPALVAAVIDDYTLVINRGRLDGVKSGQRFLIYSLSEDEIIDPETEKSLGYLEIVKGSGKVTHLQDHIATIKTDRTKPASSRIVRRNPLIIYGEEETITQPEEPEPFENARIGDKAKPI
jgi:hypothetical protein